MARTTPTLVGSIIEVDSSIEISPFIDTANELVTELCLTSGYSEARLEMIERWLSAHFYAIRDPRTLSESVAGMGERYEGQADMGLNFTRYGQQVMLLDTKGSLASLHKSTTEGKSRTVSLKYVGELE